jgi:MEMO1 family protein
MNFRDARMAGSWYPDDADVLRKYLTGFLESADLTVAKQAAYFDATSKVNFLLSPHAGYVYSGKCAAHSYATLKKWNPERIIVLAPSHRDCFSGASIWGPTDNVNSYWKTPLGNVPVDYDFCRELVEKTACAGFGQDGHREEHSLELQLPFLQLVASEFELVPVAMGIITSTELEQLTAAISSCLDDKKTLIVASTDLSHFYSEAAAREIDGDFIKAFLEMNPAAFEKDCKAGNIEACGAHPVALVMRLAGKMMENPIAEIIDYRTSAQISGDISSVVGYLSARIFDRKE